MSWQCGNCCRCAPDTEEICPHCGARECADCEAVIPPGAELCPVCQPQHVVRPGWELVLEVMRADGLACADTSPDNARAILFMADLYEERGKALGVL